MASVPIQHTDMVLGVDRTTEAHLIHAQKWWDSNGYRFGRGKISQLPRKKQLSRAPSGFRYPITAINSIPVSSSKDVLLLFAGSRVFRLNNDSTMSELQGDNKLVAGGVYNRWSTFSHGKRVYFTSEKSRLSWTDGSRVKQIAGTLVPSARYVTVFYDHLVVANYTQNGAYYPYRVGWSDLRNIDIWEPKRSNEADHYDCEEKSHDLEETLGITGLGRMGKSAFVYTSSGIFEMNYVGLPRVMNTEARLPGVGCDFKHGLASFESLHLFPSKILRNFFRFNGADIQSLQGGIANYFFDDLNPDSTAQQLTWSCINREENEVWWIYISKNSSILKGYDKAVVYNVRENIWYPTTVENVTAYHDGAVVGGLTSALSGAAGNLGGTAADLGGNLTLGPLWGSWNGRLLKEVMVRENSVLQTPVPFLETGDFFHEDLGRVKESDSMVIDAEVSEELKVEISKRAHFSEEVVFEEQPKRWKVDVAEKRLGLKDVSGRVLRYKFSPAALNTDSHLPVGSLHTEIETKYYPEEIYEVTEAKNSRGTFFPPYLGDYLVTLIGPGGGGGAQTLLSANTNLISSSASSIEIDSKKKPRTQSKFYGYLQNLIFSARSNTSNHIVLPFVEGQNPNLALTTEQRDALVDGMLQHSKDVLGLSTDTLEAYLSFRFEKTYLNEQSVVLMEHWLARFDQVTIQTGFFWHCVIRMSLLSSERKLRRAGGGGGGFLQAMVNVANKSADRMHYQAGRVIAGHEVSGESTGGANLVSSSFVYHLNSNWTLDALPGIPGGFTEISGFIPAPPGGGTIALGSMTSILAITGDTAIAEDPASGPTVTTAPKGGRGYSTDGVKQNWTPQDMKGQVYGAGGCGQREDFKTNLKGTEGASGYISFRWRVDRDGNAAVAPIVTGGSPIQKRTMKTSASSSFEFGGDPNKVYKVRLAIRGVVRIQSYTGGIILGQYARTGGTISAGTNFSLALGDKTVQLNVDGASENYCRKVSYDFWTTIRGGTVVKLEVATGATQYEPRGSDGKSIDTTEGSDGHEPQYLTVEVLEIEGQVSHDIFETKFISFVEEIKNLRAEK